MTLLSIILFIVVAAMYLQFRNFGSDDYWIYVIILILGWVASRIIIKVQTGSLKNNQIDWKEFKPKNWFRIHDDKEKKKK